MMSVDREGMGWMCGRSSMVNLHRVSSIVREMREPCMQHSPTKRNKMLKPEKWQTIFDTDGKVIGFRKALKLIVLGGIDPSIRAEVWEFLLGCYALSSTSEYRRQLRMARRKRYNDLIKQCHMMHSSIGTGKLAYIVGSKVMDARTLSKESCSARTVSEQDCHDNSTKEGAYSGSVNERSDISNSSECKISSSGELPSFRPSTAATNFNYSARNLENENSECQYARDSFYDFPHLPVTNLFKKEGRNENGGSTHGSGNSSPEHTRRFNNEHMYSFQISNNVDLAMESDTPSASNNKAEIFRSDSHRHAEASKRRLCEKDRVNQLEILPNPEPTVTDDTISNQLLATDDRVSEWLWTLHRIVVDVVRTDSHLDFYGDSKNVARMSDILAVYAWVDPATGYCQGMSDLLSPFVVLYEDNADAFWCFEMLLRRMRENFQMEGPTGVMKQLQALWKILELTDAEIYQHLSTIGAESLHFAFRMLLVLFRRELSFDEALCMWEMMWAADFDEALCQQLEESCLEPLVLQIRKSSSEDIGVPETGSGKRKLKNRLSLPINNETHNNGIKSISIRPFCGLSKSKFWTKDYQVPLSTTSVTRNADVEISVFCVAAILIINRQLIAAEAQSIDDVIKMFNDNKLKFNVKRCIRTAIKLRKKYFYKLLKLPRMGN